AAIVYEHCVYVRFHVFFFSSRRRHTRSKRDWSSDVCSSDLPAQASHLKVLHAFDEDLREGLSLISLYNLSLGTTSDDHLYDRVRSEERRVGKEWRCRWGVEQYKKNKQAVMR